MYSKENWQSMAEKEPPFGYDDNFQTSPSTAQVVLHGKTAVLAAVRLHQVGHIVLTAHVNAYKKWVHDFHLPAWRFQASRL